MHSHCSLAVAVHDQRVSANASDESVSASALELDEDGLEDFAGLRLAVADEDDEEDEGAGCISMSVSTSAAAEPETTTGVSDRNGFEHHGANSTWRQQANNNTKNWPMNCST